MISLHRLQTGFVLVVAIFQGCALAPQSSQRSPAPIKQSIPSTSTPDEGPRTSPLMIPRPQQPEYLPQSASEVLSPSDPPAVTEAVSSSNPVVVSLLNSAAQYETQGNFGRAAASIERGLRIAPKEAHLWLRLAHIRLQQDRPQQAETLSRKSIRFAAGDSALLADSWLVIAEARGRQGDLSGVVEAREKAAQHQ
ncbi:MAG: hypothetical protein DSZ28_04095 [Thiothrix sp.]|nr:MAG: hypothetical protein DSZ28_04095 [Thiothrix sp.]